MVGIVSLVLCACLVGGTDGDLLERARDAVHQGLAEEDSAKARQHFKEAKQAYLDLEAAGNRTPALYLNLGNAALLEGDLPRALLAYRLGLQLAPDQADLHLNLAHARQQVEYASPDDYGRPPREDRPPWLPHLPPRTTFVASWMLYAAGWICLGLWQLWERRRLAMTALVLFAIAGLGLAGVAWDSARVEQEARTPVVVVAKNEVYVRKGNGFSYPRINETPLNKGVEARLLFERSGWVRIELGGGEIGWVPRADVLIAD